MNKRTIFLTALILFIVIISSLLFFYWPNQSKFSVPAIENIKSVKIHPYKVGGNMDKSIAFNLNNSQQNEVVIQLIEWLNSSKSVKNTGSETILQGSTPTYLELEMKNGDILDIKASNTDNQINIYKNDSELPIRQVSPEIYKWINTGWKELFPSENN